MIPMVDDIVEEEELEEEEVDVKPYDYYLLNMGSGENPIVFQGELYRFRPGIQNNFISRWVQVSTHAFRYYKNMYGCQGTSKPLLSLPNSAILRIVPFTPVNKEAYTKGKRRRTTTDLEQRLFENMFEIELYPDYEDNEDVYLQREFDQQQKSVQGNSTMNTESYMQVS